ALIAHSSLATTDGAAALLIFAAAVMLIRWRQGPSWIRTATLGLILGLLLLAKFSTIAMFALALVWMVVPGKVSISERWKKTATAVVLALFVVWAGYFFHVARLTVRGGTLTAEFPHW